MTVKDGDHRCGGSGRRLAPRRSAVTGLAMALALVTSACSSGGGPSATRDIAADYGDGKFSDVGASPLAKYMGFGDLKGQDAKFREDEKKREATIASCMNAQGFTYIPFIQSGASLSGPNTLGDLTRRQFVDKWGFAISTMTSADGKPVEGSFLGGSSTESDNPNQKARDAMSASESAAYDKALYGAGPEFGPPGSVGSSPEASHDPAKPSTPGTIVPDFASMGCQGQANAEQSGLNTEQEQNMGKLYEDLGKRIQADPRTKALISEYRVCMETAGFPDIKKPDDVYENVSSKMSALYGNSTPEEGSGEPIKGDGDAGPGTAPGPG